MNAEELLDVAHRSGLAVVVEDGDLIVRGSGPQPADLIDSLFDHASELAELLSCASCGATGPRLVETYWGPRFCPSCCAAIVEAHDAADSWPAVSWVSEVSDGTL
ncbi:MAG: hypothetical protein ABSB09_02915 [Acidimicrobiales bacterium]|jgi:hypothetical protein